MGDQVAVILCDALRTSTRLRSLTWDKNNIGIGGWQGLVNLLASNRVLCHCPYPTVDVEKATKDAKNKEQFREKAKEVHDKLQDLLKRNAGGNVYDSAYLQAKQERAYTIVMDRPISMAYPEAVGQQMNQAYTYDQQGIPPPPPMSMSPPTPPSRKPSQAQLYGGGVAPPMPPPQDDFWNQNAYDQMNQPPPQPPEDNIPPAPPMNIDFSPYDPNNAYDPNQQMYDANGGGGYTDEFVGQEFDDTAFENSTAPPPPPPPF